mgnify:CR=1 FL=1
MYILSALIALSVFYDMFKVNEKLMYPENLDYLSTDVAAKYEKFYNDGLGYYHWYTKLRLFQKGYDLNSDTYYIYGTTNRSNFDNHSKGFIGKNLINYINY